MNATTRPLTPAATQHLEPSGIVQPPAAFPAFRKPPGLFSLAMLLAGIMFLLGGAPSAHADRVPDNCTGSGLGINLFTSSPDVHVGDTLHYSINVFNGILNSGRIVCDAEAIQAFIVTPDNVSHPITLVRTYLHQGENDFYLDVVSYVVRAQDIQPDGTLLATARDTGIIHQNDTDSVGGGFQGVNTEVNLPCVLITALCVGGVGENGLITFTGTVTNCGNNTLVGVTVTNFHDSQAFTVLFPTNLARGQTANFSGSYIPVNPCLPSTAILTVRATDEFTSTPRVTTNFTTITCQNTLTPGIKVLKFCPASPVAPGQFINFTGSVSNTGNVTLTNIVVVNNQPAANTVVFNLASLAPGVVANFGGSYLAPTNCSVSDTLNATASSRCGTGVSSVASATCPILTTGQIAVVVNCPITPVLSGGSFIYSGTVQNTGNITLTNIVVTSDRPAANTTIFTTAGLAPGAVASFTTTVTVPANACAVTTTFSGTGRDMCTLTPVTNIVATTCNVTTAPGIVVTLACPAVSASAGGSITYSGTVRNSGNVTLNNVFVVNNQPSLNTPVIGPITLAPGVTVSFTSTFTAPLDACTVSSTVNATGNDNCSGLPVTSASSATCNLITTPSIVVTQLCPVSPTVPGGVLTYTGTVRNAGNITLTNIVVLNNLSGATPVFTATTLAPGAVAGFSGSYIATTNCASTSTSTATARSICGVAVAGSVSATCTILTAPQIVVAVNCPVTPVLPGGSIVYSGTVRNTGNITLTNVVVVSDRPSANTTVFTVAGLAPGATASFTSTVTVPTGACAVTTTFSGVARDMCTLSPVTNTVSTTCNVVTAPAIAVTLTCPVVSSSTGGAITYTGTVRNSGNVTLNNVFVVNNQPSLNTPAIGPITLAPGAISNFTANFTAPLDACTVSSTVTATGSDNCTAAMVTNTATATCTLITTPGILVTQDCPVGPSIPGAFLFYTGTVRNSGNITLTNVIVLNNLSGAAPIFTIATLAPGSVAGFTGSYLTPTNCSTSSTSTATGRSICGVSVTNTASATCPILSTPAIVVTQTCPVISVLPGGILTYSGTVSNAGNITLTNVVVINNQPASNTVIFTIATLAPGVKASFTGSYQVPTNCCVVSSTVRARGQACEGVMVTDTATRTCTVQTAPRLAVTKICAPGILRPGDLLTYSGSVSNAGNIALINVSVVNNQSGTPVLQFITLAPGESIGFLGSYTVPPDFCGTDIVTASGLDVCTFLPVSGSVTTTCPVTTAPRITVTKNCPLLPTPRGGLYVYTGTVGNPGNVTLVNVFVTDNQPTNNTPVIGPITLAPGATVNFTNSYIAPHCCCMIIDTLTARGQDRCTGSNVTSTATTVCPLLSNPSIALVQICPAPVTMGNLYVFGGYVTNTGDVTLTNVFVFGPQGTNTPLVGPIELAPHESENYIGSYVVPFNTCSVSVSTSGRDTCGGNAVSNLTSCPVATTTLLVLSQNCSASPAIPGGLLTYSGTVSNAGNITVTGIVVTNSQSGNSPLITVASLAPGATTNYVGSYLASAGCSSTSVTTAKGVSICGVGVTNSVTSTCPLITSPLLTVTQNCPASPTSPGGLLTYSGSVSNAGNITLNNVVVTNSRSGNTPLITIASLAPGASVAFTGSYVAPATGPSVSTSTARATSLCGAPITNSATSSCAVVSAPGISVVKHCPPTPPAAGTVLVFTGTAINIGNVTLTNVFVVNNQPGPNTVVLGPITLAPGARTNFTGGYLVPLNTCSISDTLTASGNDSSTGITVTSSDSAVCPIRTTPAIFVTETCPPGPVSPGSTVVFGGSVSNSGNITLTNVMVFSHGAGSNTAVLGPITLAPGVSAPYSGSYVATNGSGRSTNTTVITNTTVTITTNTVTPTFGTIDPVSTVMTDRFNVTTNLHGLMFADQDEQWGPTLFYATRHPATGPDKFVTISTITPNIGVVTDRFNVTATNYDALTFAAPDVGHGVINFYYVHHDAGNVSIFGQIVAQGASSSADFAPVLPNAGYSALAFAAADVSGFGANLFYSIRQDNAGVATLGTISVAGAMVVTDRYTLGVNRNYDSMVFVPGTVSTWGTAIFTYLRHDAVGSYIGTIDPVTHVATDRINFGTNLLTSLTFTATDVGYGPNLFYFLRPERSILTTNTVTTFITNSTVTFNTTNAVSASGMDICQGRTVGAAADCAGTVGAITAFAAAEQPGGPAIGQPTFSNGSYNMTFPSENGKWYSLQYKNTLSDPTWIDLETVIGTGGDMTVSDEPNSLRLMRFYRLLTP